MDDYSIPVVPSVPKELAYNTKAVFATAGAADADRYYAVAEVYEWDGATQLYKVRQPTADNIPWSACAVLPGAKVARSDTQVVGCAMFHRDTRPIEASLTDSSDAPAVGDDLGTVSGAWGLKKGNTGFVCLGVVEDEGTGAGKRRIVLVRPTGGGGGGGSIDIVQAIADGASGTVSVKQITLKGDVTASPNFEQTGDATTLPYFKL